ncbi:hypothetical protein C8R43DRAFT_881040 [Mycena crocata]|nr:hypothetical protein C8R43DRAFT_881040 [Mycena crocata]
MDDVSALKAEIKTWERNFRATYGRDPSIQDIKEQPNLVQKYKDYKRLSKASEPAPSIRPSTAPSTPPRGQSRHRDPTVLLSKPRSIEPAQPLSGYNPFSPEKNKGKQKELSHDTQSRTIPFRIRRDPSPDPVPRISSTSGTTNDPFAPTPNDPLSRARKRLRGEPVSPSPNKEKRRRIIAPQVESDDEEDLNAANTSFVDDSPVKLPSGVRSFKLLFDEASTKPKFSSLQSQTAPTGLFKDRVLSIEEKGTNSMDVDGQLPRMLKKRTGTRTKDDPFFDPVEEGNILASDDEMADNGPSQTPTIITRSLLAPSPPPATGRSSGKQNYNGKSRGKSEGQKRVNILGSDEEDGNDSSDGDAGMSGIASRHRVRLFDRTASRGRVHEDGLGADTYHLIPRPTSDTNIIEPQTSESISLPDTLLSILSLAPNSSHTRQDEHVVDRLLYGSRRGNYDSSKGGEIWGVGELKEDEREFALNNGLGGSGGYDDEDDWEGEGVPWEVGEL